MKGESGEDLDPIGVHVFGPTRDGLLGVQIMYREEVLLPVSGNLKVWTTRIRAGRAVTSRDHPELHELIEIAGLANRALERRLAQMEPPARPAKTTKKLSRRKR